MSKAQDSARYIANFADCLFRAKMVERSNSVRARLFRVFHDAVCYHRREIPEIRYLLDVLGKTGPFDSDEGRFRSAIKIALQLLGRSSALSEIAETIRNLAVNAHAQHLFEACLDASTKQAA